MAADEPIAALVAHDSEAWQRLFDRYYVKMFNFACLRTGDRSAAEDIAAEVFVAAAKGIAGYRPGGAPFAAWLYRIARNRTADHLERRRRQPTESLAAIQVACEAGDGHAEAAADISRALPRLTREQQEVIVLRFFSECSLEETAAAMGKSVNAIKVLQHRALAALRRYLAPGGKA